MAYSFYVLANEIRRKKTKYDNLFLQKDIYDYKLDYELSILGYYCNWQDYDIQKSSMKVISCSTTPEEIVKSVLNNYKFYATSLSSNSLEGSLCNEMNTIGDSIDIDKTNFQSSTPSLCRIHDKLAVNVRFVNYRIDDAGNYINQEKIVSINVIAYFDTTVTPWKKISENILHYNDSIDHVYVGLEDVRLFSYNDRLLYNCNRPISMNRFNIESGVIDQDKTIDSKLLTINIQKPIEKNWVLFSDNNDQLRCIYQWNPLTICDIEKNECIINRQLETPNFFRYVRGSTNGVRIENEIWFLCHLVSYEGRRYYYHLFVVLDLDTLTLKKYTKLFSFEKSPVEYTLGFIYLMDSNSFLIGYSTLDKETKYITVSKEYIRELMI